MLLAASLIGQVMIPPAREPARAPGGILKREMLLFQGIISAEGLNASSSSSLSPLGEKDQTFGRIFAAFLAGGGWRARGRRRRLYIGGLGGKEEEREQHARQKKRLREARRTKVFTVAAPASARQRQPAPSAPASVAFFPLVKGAAVGSDVRVKRRGGKDPKGELRDGFLACATV